MLQLPKIYQVGTLTYTRPKLAILFFWLLWGDFCFILMETVVPSILPLKFKALGASNTTLVLILSTIPMIINTVLNPVISFKSDRYRSPWGRRIPFILFTLPFLVVFMIGVGLGDKIGFHLFPWVHQVFSWLTPNQFAIAIISFFMIIFSFFNTFVNAVFWYLFNDVVPEQLLARFMSWFRTVSTVASSVYSFFIFKYAESHTVEIFVGASILYFIGFGLMCLKVKEGQYPPPPEYVDGQTGPFAALKTFGKECHSLSHYWYVFLISVSIAGGCGVGPFGLYFSQSIGLDLDMIGKIVGASNITIAILILASGWLADRYHPIRVVIAGLLLQILVAVPTQFVWLFWHPSPQVAFYYVLVTTVVCAAPAGALIGVLDPPMYMRIFPRDRYGQFCSANAMWRSISMVFSGVLAGIYLDVLTRYVGPVKAYFYIPFWSFLFSGLTLFFMIKLYRSWKKYGGDEAYVPPSCTPESESEAEKVLATSA